MQQISRTDIQPTLLCCNLIGSCVFFDDRVMDLLASFESTREARVVQGVRFCHALQTLSASLTRQTRRHAKHKLILNCNIFASKIISNREIPLIEEWKTTTVPLFYGSLHGLTVTTTL